jgi:hypothetical protein
MPSRDHATECPRQARAKVTVDTILAASARSGSAGRWLTTNQVAETAGVSIARFTSTSRKAQCGADREDIEDMNAALLELARVARLPMARAGAPDRVDDPCAPGR